MSRRIIPALERLFAKRYINPRSGCWEFTGYLIQGTGKYERLSGYGYIRDTHSPAGKGKLILVHRLAYREIVGAIPPGFEVDHKCCVRHCFNPKHLEPRTHAVNVALTVFRNQLGEIEDIPFP